MPAHSVRDDEEVVLLEHDEGVLVVLPLEADVAHSCRYGPHQVDGSGKKIGSLVRLMEVKADKLDRS
jgi:hypothetical protein